MPSSNVCWGIEIGSGAIKAVKIEADNQRVNLLDYAVIEHPKVLSTPGIDANDVLRVSLGQLVSQYDLSKASIAVSVPGNAAFAKFAKLPPVDPKKVPDIVKFEAMQQIPFPLEEVEWDYQTFQSPDTPEIEVGIFAIKRDRVNERLQLLADVGITPDYVTLSPLSAFNALAYDLEFTDKTPGTIIVDVGTSSTDLIICEAGRVWIRTFPIGGHNFTDAIVSTFKVSYPKAEEIKKKAEESQHARQVFQAMRPVFTDLAADISRSIGYYTNLHKDAKLDRVIGIGATFQLPGIRKFLKQQLGIEVYRVEQFKRVNTDGLKSEERGKKFNEQSVSLATAYGLALQGIRQSAISANLMPVTVIRETMWKGKVKWFGMAAGLAVAASASMFIRPTLDYFAIAGNSEPAAITTALNRARENTANATELGLDKPATPDYRAANMLALLENRQTYAFIMDDLGQIVKFANEKAKGWKLEDGSAWPVVSEANPVDPELAGFRVVAFQTEYRGAGAGGSTDGSADPSAAPVGGKPQIAIKMAVATSRANEGDANRFMINTIDAWLKQNAERKGVPYKILPSPRNTYWQRLRVEDLPKPEEQKREGQAEQPAGGREERGGGGRGKGTGGAGEGNDRFVPGEGAGGGQGLGNAPLEKLLPPRRWPGPMFTMQVDWTIEFVSPTETKPEETGT
jgi:type IV pilus assembly protein PilM